ncbi:hypothetical protein F2P56_033228, partial [Juglans regia]
MATQRLLSPRPTLRVTFFFTKPPFHDQAHSHGLHSHSSPPNPDPNHGLRALQTQDQSDSIPPLSDSFLVEKTLFCLKQGEAGLLRPGSDNGQEMCWNSRGLWSINKESKLWQDCSRRWKPVEFVAQRNCRVQATNWSEINSSGGIHRLSFIYLYELYTFSNRMKKLKLHCFCLSRNMGCSNCATTSAHGITSLIGLWLERASLGSQILYMSQHHFSS